jgi:ATP-binding cassette, subfamily B, bacterial
LAGGLTARLGWNCRCMTTEPTGPSALTLIGRYARPELGRIALLAAALVAGVGLSVFAPLLVRRFIDTVAGAGRAAPLGVLWGLAGLFLAATLAAQAARLAASHLAQRIGWAATNRLRADLAAHCLGLDLAFHHAHAPGEMIERVDGDVGELAGVFSQVLLQVAGAALTIGGVIAVLMLQDWRVGAVLGALAAAALAVLLSTRNLAGRTVALERQSRAELAGFLEERIGGLDDIRAGAGDAHVMRRLGEITGVLNARNYHTARVGRAVWVMSAAMFAASSLAALALGVWLFQRGQASLGAVYLYVQYAAMMREPFYLVGAHLQEVQRAAGSLRRIQDLLALRPTLVEGGACVVSGDWPDGPPALSFARVGFSYGAGPPVLSDVSFEIAPGEVLGVVGRTGAGKTTLARLIGRLYDPTSGVIRLGGRDIRTAALPALRRRVGVVTQDVRIFVASVRDNAGLFDPALPDARIAEVLADLGLGAWLARQPAGLASQITATSLSAGEAQLLAFARVFLRDPGLVILDEATSRLDPATDRLVERATEKLLGARTAIIIAHKLETVRRADRIIVLEAGRSVEAGPRAALEANPRSRFAAMLAAARAEALA